VITHDQDNRIRWVSPFGNRGIKACSQLPHAYRSVPRPSSPVCAKASTNCPYLTLESPHHQRQHWIGPKTDTKLGRAVCRSILVWMFISQPCLEAPHLSGQPDGDLLLPICSGARFSSEEPNQTPSRHRFEKPIHNVKKLAVSDCNTAREEQISLLHQSDIG
jgi:hypothetical protein